MIHKHQRRRIGFFLHPITGRKDLVVGGNVYQILVLEHRPRRDRLVHPLHRAGRVSPHTKLERLVAQHVVIWKGVTDNGRLLEVTSVKLITRNH